MVVEGGLADGDTRLMATCLFEEFLRTGHSATDLRAMSVNPSYQALYAIRATLGDLQTDDLLAEAAARVGVHRFRTHESSGTSMPAVLTVGATDDHRAGCVADRKEI